MIVEFMNGHFLACRVEVDDEFLTGKVYTDTGVPGTVNVRPMSRTEVANLRTLCQDLMKGADE